MKINFLTIFPKYYDAFKSESIVAKAIQKKIIEINVIDFREFTLHKQKKVDDEIYGGGSGMLLMIEPIDRALASIKEKTKIILLLGTQNWVSFLLKKIRRKKYDSVKYCKTYSSFPF